MASKQHPTLEIRGLRYEFLLAAAYLVCALAWILLSDQALAALSDDPRKVVFFSLVKGVSFVFATALMLFFLLRRIFRRFRRVQRSLEESEARYRMLIEGQTDLVVKVDREGRFLFASPSYCDAFGKNEDELMGSGFMPLVHEDDREATAEAMKALYAPPHKAYLEQRALTAKGWRWLAWQDTAILDAHGEVSEIIGVARDITARREMETELRRLSAAINQSAEAMVIMDTQGVIQYLNPAFEKVTGYASAEALGRNIAMMRSTAHDEAFYAAIWQTIGGGESWRGRIVNRQKNGTLYTAEAAVSPVRDTGGTIVNHVMAIRDITQELKMEENLRQIQKMDAIGRLAGGVAHDFNNILQSILGFSSILLAELDQATPQYGDVVEIRNAARRAGDLTRQLLAFSRKQAIEYTVLDLNQLVARNQKMMQRLIGAHIQFVSRLSEEMKPVRADAIQLEQVLLNLFVNARDAMPDGGTLVVATALEQIAEGHPSIPAGLHGEFVCLSVTDTGCGINEEVREHLFEPFFTTKQVGQGTGLGLSVVYGIVHQHGGRILVESQEGAGASFKVYLPVYDSCDFPAAEIGTVDLGSAPAGRGESILVVEDDPVLCELNVRILRNAGYAAVAVSRAQDALSVFERHPASVDLLLCDIVLPDRNGLSLAEEFRQRNAAMPVLLYSGFLHDFSVHESILRNGFHFLEKPVSAFTLLQTIRELLDVRPAKQAQSGRGL